MAVLTVFLFFFFFQAEDGIRDLTVTGVQTCALPICAPSALVPAPQPLRARRLHNPTGERRSEEHTSELQSQSNLVCRLLLEKKKKLFSSVLSPLYHTLTPMRIQCARHATLASHLYHF